MGRLFIAMIISVAVGECADAREITLTQSEIQTLERDGGFPLSTLQLSESENAVVSRDIAASADEIASFEVLQLNPYQPVHLVSPHPTGLSGGFILMCLGIYNSYCWLKGKLAPGSVKK